jgi:ABC-2 type transport system permease protein
MYTSRKFLEVRKVKVFPLNLHQPFDIMFKEIFRFELKYRKKRAATYIYFGIFFLMCFLAVTTDVVQIGGAQGQIKENAPFVIARMTAIMSIFLTLVTSAVMGVAVLRDFEHNTEAILFSTPMGKFSYIMGRFWGSFFVLVLIGSGIWLAFMIGDFWPTRKAEKLLPFNFWSFLQPYLVFCVPNMFFAGSLLFMSGTLSRKTIVIYTQGILLLVLYLASQSMLQDLEQKELGAMIDPFGIRAFAYEVQYWTPSERNTQLVPFSGYILYNRLLWIGVGFVALAATYFAFSFNVVRNSFIRRKAAADSPRKIQIDSIPIPKTDVVISFSTRITQLFQLTRLYFTSIVKEIPFIAIVFSGFLLLILNAVNMNELYGTSAYPTTYNVLGIISGSFNLFLLIIVVFYTGELVWRERSVKMNLIVDALPITDFTTLIAKFLGLLLVYIILLLMLVLSGVLIQVGYGYYKFELSIYFKSLFSETMTFLLLYTFLSIFIQVMVNNKFLGYAVCVGFFILTGVLSQLGLEHGLFQFATASLGTYSDMNVYGHFVTPFTWFGTYWFAFAFFLFIVAVVFSVRGSESVMNIRWKAGKLRLNRSLVMMVAGSAILFVSSGFYIYYNTNIINEYQTSDKQKEQQAAYEKKYKKYETLNQPRIIESNIKVDIYPYDRDFVAEGFYYLKNKSNEPIPDIHIQQSPDTQLTVEHLTFDREAKAKEIDKDFHYYIYELDSALAPGDSVKMNFKVSFNTRGFQEKNSNLQVIYNGTFFNNTSFFPTIGYQENFELGDDDDREEQELKEKERMLSRNDPRGRNMSLFGDDADHIRFEMVIGTAQDQIAIAPGYLQKEWSESGRKYFHYKMDAPMCNFYSVVSARYAVKRDKWKDVNLEIYYHPGHEYNLDRMMQGMKDALDYYSTNFGPFQYRQMRIMEFPRYATFAQSFANTVPFSEGIGFIAKIDDPDKDIDYTYYVTAHEVAHQWWGHQVMEAGVKGNAMLSESMSQYSALMVMKHAFAPETIERYLKYELDSYLRGRTSESKKEQPLEFVEGQGYIHYNKASLIFFALQDYIGEDRVNEAFRKYLNEWKFKDAPYPTSADLLKYIKEATPDSLQSVIHDMFETITLFENKALEAEYEEKDTTNYIVTLKISAEKMRADSVGMESPIQINDWIDIGVYGRDKQGKDKLIYLKKHKITQKENTYIIPVREKPRKAGIDPLHKLIDRHSGDNTKSLVKKAAP